MFTIEIEEWREVSLKPVKIIRLSSRLKKAVHVISSDRSDSQSISEQNKSELFRFFCLKIVQTLFLFSIQ